MTTKIAALSGAIIALCLLAGAAIAQDHARNWESGHVVQVTHVQIKPGMFNAYINDLNSLWRRSMEIQKEDGHVVDYSIYSNPNVRDGEPHLILTVTYENWAAFDLGVDYFEEVSKKLVGSMDEMREAAIDREALRTISSSFVLQEVKFAD